MALPTFQAKLHPGAGPAADATRLYVATLDGQVFALNFSFGVAWEASFPGERFIAAPVLTGGLLLVGGSGGTVALLDPATGAVQASAQLGGSVRGFAAADGGHVVAAVGASKTRLIVLGPVPSLATVSSLELDAHVVEGGSLRIGQVGLGDGQSRVWVPCLDSTVRTFRVPDLQAEASMALLPRSLARIALVNNADAIAATTAGMLARLRLVYSGGQNKIEQVWAKQIPAALDAHPVVAALDGGLAVFLAAGAGGAGGKLYRVNGATGASVWELAVPYLGASVPVAGNYGEVYAATTRGGVAAVNSLTGGARFRDQATPVTVSPDPQNPAQTLQSSPGIRASLVLVPGLLVSAAEDGVLRQTGCDSTAVADGPYPAHAGGRERRSSLSDFADPPYAKPVPAFSVSPSSLAFTESPLQTQSAAKTVTAANFGAIGSRLNIAVTKDQPWIAADPLAAAPPIGTAEKFPLRVVTRPTGLLPGVYNGTVTLTDAENSLVANIPVTLTVVVPLGTPALSTTAISLAVPSGKTATRKFNLQNVGVVFSEFDYSVTTDQPWLSATPHVGSLKGAGGSDGEFVEVEVAVDATALTPGDYSGTVDIALTNATLPSVSVSVVLTVNPALAILTLDPGFLAFPGKQGETLTTRTFKLQNTGPAGAKFYYQVYTLEAWLELSGSLTGVLDGGQEAEISVGVETVLAAGSYAGQIVVNAGGADVTQNSPGAVNVSLTLSAAPLVFAAPDSLGFSAVQDAAPPPVQALVVSNAGSMAGTFTVERTQSWIVGVPVAPETFDLQPGQTKTYQVTVDPSALGAGTHSGKVRITSPTAPNSPFEVPVVASVGGYGVVVSASPASLAFEGVEGATDPAPRTFNVTNIGSPGTTLNVVVKITASAFVMGVGNVTFIAVSDAAFAVAAGATKTVAVEARTLGLVAWGGVKTYEGILRIKNADAPTQYVDVAVSLKVTK